ncbi:SKG6 domain-containing protein [Rhizoctonia solani AG-1 IA]|uniref:SKG6 domain-containing protein n=1 Tax=Thanatephorus cucumeris (strain AG1-IA) TaxID=983506 RepID=L8WFV8_THACA|nr:SKG6 domain-containing protein [Rhizoctonia solani AG-1 IA]
MSYERQIVGHTPRKYADQQYQGSIYPVQYYPLPNSPSTSSGGNWHYTPVASPLSPNFSREVGGSGSYSNPHSVLPMHNQPWPSDEGRSAGKDRCQRQCRPSWPSLYPVVSSNNTHHPPKAALSMPLYNITIDDISALIEYTPAGRPWTDSPTSDQELHNYWDGTYHSSDRFGARASFRFQGTAVWLYAAKRSRHGPFEILLDGQKVYDGDGYSASPLYDQVMYNATDLAPTWHNLTCINSDPTNQTFTEVDYIRWTTVMPETLAESLGTTIPYSPNNMSYSSLSAWTEDAVGSNPSMFVFHHSPEVANLIFNPGLLLPMAQVLTSRSMGMGLSSMEGLGPLLAGSGDPNCPMILLALTNSIVHKLTSLKNNLTSGSHNLIVTNRGTRLAITSAKPILWRDPNEPSSDNGSDNHTTNIGLIVGVVVGVVVGLSAIAFILLFVLRRRRRKQRDNDLRVRPSNEPAFLDATPFELPASPNERASSIQPPSSARNSKYRNESSQYAAYPLQYQPVLGSPGMSSRGSFEVPHHLAVPGSSTGGSSSDPATSTNASRIGGKSRYSAEPTSRDELPEGVAVIRDSDAGPILLPPAYSAATEARAPVELPESFNPSTSSFASPAVPTPVSSAPISSTHPPSPSIPISNTPGLPPGAASPIVPNSNLGKR